MRCNRNQIISMKQNDQDLDHLFELSRNAPPVEPPDIPFGFAARVAGLAYPSSGQPADALLPALRWSFALCVAATLIVAAINGPSLLFSAFTPDIAYENHVSELVLFGDK